MNNFRRTVLSAVVVAALATGSSQAATKKVVCQGDSITFGYLVSTPYPTRLASALGGQVINEGIVRHTTGAGLSRIVQVLDAYNPTHLCLLYGTNDVNGPNDLNASASRLVQMAQIARGRYVVPIIGTIPPFIGPKASLNSRARYLNSRIRANTGAGDYFMVDIESAFGSASGLMQSDGFHPNDSGQQVISNTYAPTVQVQPVLPGSSTVIAPTGTLGSNRRPSFSWTSVDGSAWYNVLIYKDGVFHTDGWTDGATHWTPENDLPCGNYSWWVRTWNTSGDGRWSNEGTFAYPPEECCVPEVIPSGTASFNGAGSVNYTFPADPCATSYQLVVQREGTTWHSQWYNTGLRSGNIALTVASHAYGNYTWWVQGLSVDGIGAWSNPHAFTYGTPLPLLPMGPQASAPGWLTWDDSASADADWFYIWMSRNGAEHWKQWVHVDNTLTGSGGTRHFQLPAGTTVPYGNYEWWIQGWLANGVSPWSQAMAFTVGTPIPQSPSGPLTSAPTKLEWDDTPTSSATWYQLWIQRDGTTIWSGWIERVDTSSEGGSIRSFRLPADLPFPHGNYQWWIQGHASGHTGPWSAAENFSRGTPVPISPMGSTGTNISELRWDDTGSAGSTWYQLWINWGSNVYWDMWVEVANTGTSGSQRFFGLPAELSFLSGDYTWWMRGWSPDGYGPWSQGADFTASD